MWNLFRGRVKARQNEEFIRMETRKCMLRPNSFSLFSHFINCFLHESLNQRPKSSRFSATKCIVLSRTLSSAFSYSCTHTCVCHYYFYRKCHGVNFFFLFFVFSICFPLVRNCFYSDFGTFQVVSKWNVIKKRLTDWHTMRTGQNHRFQTLKKKNGLNFVVAFKPFNKKCQQLFSAEIVFFYIFFGGCFLSNYTHIEA